MLLLCWSWMRVCLLVRVGFCGFFVVICIVMLMFFFMVSCVVIILFCECVIMFIWLLVCMLVVVSVFSVVWYDVDWCFWQSLVFDFMFYGFVLLVCYGVDFCVFFIQVMYWFVLFGIVYFFIVICVLLDGICFSVLERFFGLWFGVDVVMVVMWMGLLVFCSGFLGSILFSFVLSLMRVLFRNSGGSMFVRLY